LRLVGAFGEGDGGGVRFKFEVGKRFRRPAHMTLTDYHLRFLTQNFLEIDIECRTTYSLLLPSFDCSKYRVVYCPLDANSGVCGAVRPRLKLEDE